MLTPSTSKSSSTDESSWLVRSSLPYSAEDSVSLSADSVSVGPGSLGVETSSELSGDCGDVTDAILSFMNSSILLSNFSFISFAASFLGDVDLSLYFCSLSESSRGTNANKIELTADDLTLLAYSSGVGTIMHAPPR